MFDFILLPLQTDPGLEDQLLEWGNDIRTILNIITAIFAIVGGFLVFFQYMQGNDQAQKNFMKFVIGLGIVGVVNLVINFFLPDAAVF